jgi:UDP-glucose 4-epimerase
MKILVTGGCGFLGSYCAELFYKDIFDVTLLCRSVPDYMKKWSNKFKLITGDITDTNLADKIQYKEFDCIVHFAAANEKICLSNPRASIDINVFGTKNMLEVCKKRNINKFIYISTFHIYGKQSNSSIISEETLPNPTNEYGITHYFGELYCRQYAYNSDISCIVLRPSNSFSGPLFKKTDRWELVPNNFIKQILDDNKITIYSSGRQFRNFISIIDLYNAINITLQQTQNKFEIFNVGGNKNYSINELADITCSIGKKILNTPHIPIVHCNQNSKEEVFSYIFDISKIKSIGYAPLDIMEKEIEKTFINLMNGAHSE